jgi:TolA-binding protein
MHDMLKAFKVLMICVILSGLVSCTLDPYYSNGDDYATVKDMRNIQKNKPAPVDERLKKLEEISGDNSTQIEVLVKLVSEMKAKLDNLEKTANSAPKETRAKEVPKTDLLTDPSLLYGLPILNLPQDTDYAMAVNMLKAGKLKEAEVSLNYILKKYTKLDRPEGAFVTDNLSVKTVLQHVRFLIGYAEYKQNNDKQAIEMFFKNFQDDPTDQVSLQNLLSLITSLARIKQDKSACKVRTYLEENFGKRNDYSLIALKIPNLSC